MQSIGSLWRMSYGMPVGKENRMIVTGIIVLGVAAYAVWAVRKTTEIVRMVPAAAEAAPAVMEKNIAVNNWSLG